jgi:hypothetical protein
MLSWPGCDVLLLVSAARNFSCRAVLLDALLVLASWYHARSANAFVELNSEVFESISTCCALAHDALVAYDNDAAMIEAAATVLSVFSRDQRTAHCVVQRMGTRRLLIVRLQERVADTSCACVLMSVLRDCSASGFASDVTSNVLKDVLLSPCISVTISSIFQFNKVVIDSRSGSQALRSKANLLLNAASGLVLNLSTRAFNLGANDGLLISGLVKFLSDSAALVTSSLSTSCNCMSVVGRLLHTQNLRNELISDAQHGAKLIKWFLAVFHEHVSVVPRVFVLSAVCALLESELCSAVFFKAGGSTIVFDAVKCLASMHKASRGTKDSPSVDSMFTFTVTAATSSFVHNPSPWLADLHSSGHFRAQSLLMQSLNAEVSEATSAAAALLLLLIPHPSSSFVRPPSCTHIFGDGPVVSSDHACWLSPVSGVHTRSMTDQLDTDRVLQAMRTILAFCETDDMTSESSRINVDKIFGAIRLLTSKASASGAADPSMFQHLSIVFAAVAAVLGHVAYKLAVVAGRLFQEKQRKFKQAEEFSGVEDEHALLSKRPDLIEEAISQRVTKLRLQTKASDFPAHKAMLVISNEETTGVNPDDILRQYGTGGSVALVHSGSASSTDVKSVFLGFSDTEKKPIAFLPPPPHFGDVPSTAAVEGSAAFYKRHTKIASRATDQTKGNGIDTLLISSVDESESALTADFFEVERMAKDIVMSLDFQAIDSALIFTIKHVIGHGPLIIRPVLHAAHARLQLESEWHDENFRSASNAFRDNVMIRNTLIKILLRHTDDVSVVRPCLAVLCLSMCKSERTGSDAENFLCVLDSLFVFLFY